MSFEDDDSGPSLKELVTKNLEMNGVLGKLQAELRASVFLALEEEMKKKDVPLTNKKAQQLLSTPTGKLAINIIQDFLQCLSLEFTLAVFNPESNAVVNNGLQDRDSILKMLGQSDKHSNETNYPILFQLIEGTQNLKSYSNFELPASENIVASSINITDSNSKIANIPALIMPTISHNGTSEDKKTIDLHDSHSHISEVNANSKRDKVSLQGDAATGPETRSVSNHSSQENSAKDISSEDTSSSHQLKAKDNEKENLAKIESQYGEEEFNSLTESKEHSKEESSIKINEDSIETKVNQNKNKEENSVTTDDVTEDVPEEIAEESSLDEHEQFSGSSEVSSGTKDLSVSKSGAVWDYQESL